MYRQLKSIISFFLCISLCGSVLPLTVFAEETEAPEDVTGIIEDTSEQTEVQEEVQTAEETEAPEEVPVSTEDSSVQTEVQEEKQAAEVTEAVYEAPENVTELKLFEMTKGELKNGVTEIWYSFTPEETAEYALTSYSDRDLVAFLYDESMEYSINQDDDGGEDRNFKLIYELEAGKKYYYSVFLYGNGEEDVDFKVMLTMNKENHFSAEPGNGYDDIQVRFNEYVDLSVVVQGDDLSNVTYLWKQYDYDLETGAYQTVQLDETGSVLRAGPVTEKTEYYCTVIDGYGSTKIVSFNVFVDNGFSVNYASGSSSMYVAPYETAELKVDIKAENTDGITIIWYDDYWREIEDADSDTYVTGPVTESTRYIIYVSDIYGNSSTLYFYLYVENHFDAYAEGGSDIYLTEGQTATLKTIIEADNKDNLVIEWYKLINDEYVLIEGAVSDSIETEPYTEPVSYRCFVDDGFGNSQDVYFNLRFDNGFSVEIVGDASIYIIPNETATLQVKVTAKDTSKLTYRWYGYQETENGWGDYVLIEGADTDTYVTEPLIKSADYYCEVDDGYGNGDTIWFYVYPDNHLNVETDETYYEIEPGESLDLTVVIRADDDSDLKIEWEKYTDDEDWITLEGEKDRILHTGPITQKTEYRVSVYDKYGNDDYVYFYVYIDNDFSVSAEEWMTSVKPGGSVELKANVWGNDLSKLTLQWYKGTTNSDDDDNFKEIEGETGETLKLVNVNEAAIYRCEGNDGYGNIAVAEFEVSIDNGFTVKPDGSTTIYAEPEEDVRLRVIASVDEGSELTYSWTSEMVTPEGSWTYNELPDTGDTIQTGPVNWPAHYYCTVSDNYGNTFTIQFNVWINSRLSCRAVGSTNIVVSAGETAEMKIKAYSRYPDKMTIRWQVRDKYGRVQTIPGETGETLKVENITSAQTYYAEVDDGYGNSNSVIFNIFVDNDLYAEAAEEIITVKPYEQPVLQVITEANDMNGITYSWEWSSATDDGYRNFETIEGADSDTYQTSPVDFKSIYLCNVSDAYGNVRRVYFTVQIDDDFRVDTESYTTIKVPKNTTTELKVDVYSAYPEKITYSWRKDDNSISGAKSASLTTDPVTKQTEYTCNIYNGFGTSKFVTFNVVVDDGFSAEGVGAYSRSVLFNEPERLEVKAVSDEPEKITYQWYVMNERDQYIPIEGANQSVYDIDHVVKDTYYRCKVEDGYGQYEYIENYVRIRDDMNVTCFKHDFVVRNHGNAELKIDISSELAKDITINWYKLNPDTGIYEDIDNDNSQTLNLTDITESTQYYCYVRNEFGHSNSVWFEVYLIDEIKDLVLYEETTITADDTGRNNVLYRFIPEESGEYVFRAASDNYTYCELFDESFTPMFAESERGNDFSLTAYLAAGETYYFYPSCSSRINLYSFTAMLSKNGANNFSASADGKSVIYVDIGTNHTLKVNVKADDMNGITYEWAKNVETIRDTVGVKLQNTGNALELKNIRARQKYTCTVKDRYGNYEIINFEVGLKRPVSSLTLNKEEALVNRGESLRLIPVPGQNVTWKSSDEKIAAVDLDGNVTGIGKGTATITATSEDGKYTAQCSVTVRIQADNVQFKENPINLTPGEEYEIELITFPEDADFYGELSWEISDESVVIFTGPQKIKAVGEGKAEIYMYVDKGNYVNVITLFVNVSDHQWGEWVFITEPTCEKEGIVRRTALDDPVVIEERTVPPLGHDYKLTKWTWSEDLSTASALFTCTHDASHTENVNGSIVKTVTSPTCEAEGKTVNTAVAYFDGVEYIDVQEAVLSPLGHAYGEWTVSKEPTCTEPGEERRVCAHDETHVQTREVEALGHQWGEWKTVREATEEEDGEEERTCERCGEKETRVVPKLTHEHVMKKHEAVPATCFEDGSIEYYECTECGLLFEDEAGTKQITLEETIVRSTGHAYELKEWQWAEDLSTATAVFVCRNDETHIETHEAVVTFETVDGKTVYTATVTGPDQKEYSDQKEQTKVDGVTRIFGSGRWQTSIGIAEELKKVYGVDKFDTVVVANGMKFADALAGGYLAAKNHAPILIINPDASKPTSMNLMKDYIRNNVVSGGKVYILGGTGAVPESMKDGLNGYNIVRLGGDDRYQTNMKILAEAGVSSEDILIAAGGGFADSLSASASGRPILLVGKKGLTDDQKTYLKGKTQNKWYILGGTGAISEDTEKQLKALGNTPERLFGNGRYETSVAIANEFAGNAKSVVLAYGTKFPDGLCGGVLAAATGSPLLLTKDGASSDYAAGFTKAGNIRTGYVLGGTGVLADETAEKILGEKPVSKEYK